MDSIAYKINVINYTKVDDHIFYILSVENLLTGINISFSERYINLRNLYETMKKESGNKNFPSFPPKKLFGYEDEKFVKTRKKDLNGFFEKINSNQNFSKLPSLIKYIEEILKKNPNKEKISSRQIQNSLRSKNINNTNKIVGNAFIGKKFTPEEYKKDCIEGKKIVSYFNLKFISLDYNIEVKSNDNAYKKYENITKENLIFNEEDKKGINILDKGDDDNFKFVGNEQEYLKDIIYSIKNIMEENIKNFESICKIMDIDEFILK